jgi:lysophospholipase L1-like esterase
MPVSGVTVPGFETLGAWAAELSYTPPYTLGGVSGTDYGKAFQYGLARRDLQMMTAAGTYTFTFTGTSFDAILTRASASGKLNVVIDGGAATVFDTYSAATVNGYRWSSGALTAGSHTVVLSRDATSASGRYVYLEDVVTYNGDETKGFHVWNGGHYGYKTTDFITTAQAGSLETAAPDCLIYTFGFNDMVTYSAATFQTDLQTLITQDVASAAVVGKNPSVVILALYGKYGVANWADYVAAMYAVAVATPLACVLDMSLRWPQVTSSGADAATYNLYADQLHPSARGHGLLASVIADFLAPQ